MLRFLRNVVSVPCIYNSGSGKTIVLGTTRLSAGLCPGLQNQDVSWRSRRGWVLRMITIRILKPGTSILKKLLCNCHKNGTVYFCNAVIWPYDANGTACSGYPDQTALGAV